MLGVVTSVRDVLLSAQARASAIRAAVISIYEPLIPNQTHLFFPDDELEALLAEELVGMTVAGPLRSRSKLAKELVSVALGYQCPTAFKRTTPRFPGQDLDVYVQTNDNLQIWNQEVSPERRYVLIRPDHSGLVISVRIVRGQQIALWDRTGTLTSKYQAKRRRERTGSSGVSLN